MKYCPYCGAAPTGGVVSNYAQCGYEAKHLERETPLETGLMQKSIRATKKRKPKTRKPVKRQPLKPIDFGYDGYYNDVQPIDSGHIHDGLDPELIKRVIIISTGTVLIIILSVLLIFLL